MCVELTIKLRGVPKCSFWTSSKRSERQLSAVMDSPHATVLYLSTVIAEMGRAVMKRIAVDLVKSVYQVAESVRSGQVVQRKRLNR